MKKHIALLLLAVFAVSTLFVATSCDKPNPTATIEETYKTGNPELDALSEKVLKNPEDAQLRYERAKVYHQLEGYDQAIADMNVALKKDTTKAEYFHLLADVYLDNYNSRLALRVMQNAARRFPERVPTLLKYSEFQMILMQNDASLKTVNDILKLDPQEAEAYMMMGLNLRDVGKVPQAINSFQTAVELNPDLIDGWILLGNLFADKKEKIAERYFNTAVSINPENLETLSARGSYYLKSGSLEKAKKDFLVVTRSDMQHSTSFFNLGLVYLEQDSIPKAQEMLNIAIQTNPLYLKAYYYRGLTHEALGSPRKAYADFQQVARHDPEFRDVSERVARLKPSIEGAG